jgi:hypothetical protein
MEPWRLVLLVLTGCLTTLTEAGAPLEGRLPLPVASADLVFDPGAQEIVLHELVARLAQLTGQELAMTTQCRQALGAVKEPLESTAPVPKEEVYSFVEALLVRNGALIAPLTGGTRPILAVHVLNDRSTPPEPLTVQAGALGELAAHPALLVRMLLTFEHTDTRQLQTQVRQLLLDDSGANQCVPVGERGLILQGRASEMASLARLLLEADAATGKRPAAVRGTEQGGQ